MSDNEISIQLSICNSFTNGFWNDKRHSRSIVRSSHGTYNQEHSISFFIIKSNHRLWGILCPLLADIFLYSYEAEFIVFALNWKEKISISVQLHIQIHRWLIGFRLKCCYAFFVVYCGCCTSYIVLVHIQCQASIYTLSLCRGHSWRVRLVKQETLTPPGYLVSTLVCRGPWMYTVVLYCWCHSDSASVLLYFTLLSINNPDFQNYLSQMYPIELKIKDTTESNTSASYLDLLLSNREGWANAHFPLRQTWRFQLQYHKLSVPG